VPVLHYLQEVAALLGQHWRKSPVVENRQIDTRQHFKDAGMLSVAAGKREGIEQAWQPSVKTESASERGATSSKAGNSGKPSLKYEN
jgi:hypothetical protein